MEEDIKVLEEYLNYEVTKRKLSGCEILAIENLIARNKELEEMNKKLESRKYMLNAETGEVTAIPIDNNYIPKSKVRDKVIEVKDRQVTNDFITATQGKLNTIIDLEDLLQEGDK